MTVSELNEPKEWAKQGDWGSHLPLLHLAITNTDGTVFELGSGLISTPLLRQFCRENNRLFFSYDSNKEWCKKTYSIEIKNWDEQKDLWLPTFPCGLVFIDEAPGEHRKESIELFKNIADCIVIHDTEVGADYVYKMADVLSKFKYRIDYEVDAYPRTTLVSNKIDVTKWI